MEIYNEDKTLIYIDQNIISALVKRDVSLSVENGIFVYSQETINEIVRAEQGRSGAADKYLDALDLLNAKYIRYLYSDFKDTGKVVINFESTPYELYDDIVNNECQDEVDISTFALVDISNILVHKTYGGREEISYECIKKRSIENFEKLTNDLVDSFSELGINASELVESQQSYFKNLVESAYDNYPESGELTLRNELQKQLNISTVQLNNIKPPNVLGQIFDLVKGSGIFDDVDITPELFYGIADKTREWSRHDKVRAVYNQVNLIGYEADKKMHKDSEFRSFQSDVEHAAIASHVDQVWSRDEKFVKKLRAVYEFLSIDTKVVHVRILDGENN